MKSNPTLLGRMPVASGAWRPLTASLTLATAALLSACGGGGDGGSDSTTVTPTVTPSSFIVGTVTGFGSIFVDGIKYENDTAQVFDDGDSVSKDTLKLGMVVSVSGTNSNGVRTANQISYGNYGTEIKGPVSEVAEGSFTVLGIMVRTTATTLYFSDDDAPLVAGDVLADSVIEVYGYADTDGGIVATRIEVEASSVGAFIADKGEDAEYRLYGVVAGLGGTSPSYTFTLGDVAISTDGNTRLDVTPVNGASVSVRLQAVSPDGPYDGPYVANRVKAVTEEDYGDVESENEAEVAGFVSGYTDPAVEFKVSGYTVKLASNVVYEEGYSVSDLTNGIPVEVKGTISSGVLVVTRFKFESAD